MKICQFCGKEYDGNLSVCPECGTESKSVSLATDAEAAESENIKSRKKRRPGLASAIVGTVFPFVSTATCLIVHLSILLITVLIALLFPYLLALSPMAIPVINVVTVAVSVIACIFSLIGFLLSIVALAAKGNKLGIAGLLMSIFSPIIIFASEAISIATPSLLQRIFDFL